MKIASFLLGIVIIILFVVWIIALITWDGKTECMDNPNPEDCRFCPFNCDKRKGY